MAKLPKNKNTQYPSKPRKSSVFLCCFGSSLAMESTVKGSEPISKQKKKKKRTSWFSWRRIRIINKNSVSKTVPFEASISDQAHYSKSRSKSTLLHKSQAPATNPLPPPPVLPVTPYYTPTQTRHGGNSLRDTRQQGGVSPAHAKRQERQLSSTMQKQTTSKRAKTARRSNGYVVGMSVIVVTLVIMIFWGRLCAILCTSMWLYFIPRLRKMTTANDSDDPHTTESNDVDLNLDLNLNLDLDSKEYKKKVIMEGLLGRNHRSNNL